MFNREQLRYQFLAHKPFLLRLYLAENTLQVFRQLTDAQPSELDCLFNILVCAAKGYIPAGNSVSKKLAKLKHKGIIFDFNPHAMKQKKKFTQLSWFVKHYQVTITKLIKNLLHICILIVFLASKELFNCHPLPSLC